MNKKIVLVAIAAWLAGCAAQNATTVESSSKAVDPPTATPAVPAAAALAEEPAAAGDGPKSYPGWSPRKRSGQELYCKKVDVTGSMFPKEVCLTPEQLDRVVADQKANARRLLEKHTGCRTEGCQ